MHPFSTVKLSLSQTSCFLLLCFFSCCLLNSSAAQSLPQMQLQVDDANLNDGRVHFKPSSCDVEPAPSPQNLQQMSQGTGTTTYSLFVDITKTSLFYGSFAYVFYVARQSTTPPAQMCVYRVLATPSGVFVDQMSDVTFHLKGGSQPTEDGTVSIPLHNSSYKQPILRADPPDPFANVSLSGKYPVTLKITNLLRDLPVTLNGISATADNPGYWAVLPQTTLHFSQPGTTALQPEQHLDTGIEVMLVPNRWHALGASIFPIGPNKAQETVHLSIDFNTPGGIPGTLEVPLPLRFKPSFWNLALAVFIGAIIGSGIGLLLPKQGPSADLAWYKAMLIALGFGIIAEALGMILVSGNSEFRLLGFELDPYQLLPASLIGVLVGLVGFRSADDFLKVFKKAGP
jgi:hypothetical protein